MSVEPSQHVPSHSNLCSIFKWTHLNVSCDQKHRLSRSLPMASMVVFHEAAVVQI